ncbi:MAG: PAS domain S-box protein [Thermoleophilaceae bacterium]
MLARLAATLGIGTLTVRLSDGVVIEASERHARLLGRTPDQIVGSSAVDAGIVADEDGLGRMAAAAPGRVEALMWTAEGDERVVDVALERVEIEGVQCLALATRRVESSERIAEQALRASEQRYRGIVESASEGVWMLDEVDRISFVNRAMARMLGFEVHELLGRRALEFMVGESEPVGRRALRQRETGGSPHRHELAMRRKDGGQIWVEMSATPLEDDRGRYLGAVSMVADMTERHAAHAERERLEARLQQSQRLETVGQLAGGVAHDFNNLLAVILNYAYFLRERLPTDDELRADLDEIRHAAERASELTHQLLVFSRREAVQPVVLDLNEVVRDMERLVDRTVGEQVALVTDLDAAECLVEADAAQLEQVVLNLVMNARDAMPAGGTIRIETRLGTEVTLAVSDDGEGMEPEVAARAFEPYFTTKPKRAGTGLGLATVYGTVTQAGGSAEIESHAGGGTTVRIRLPRAQAARTPQAAASPEAAASDGATVLVVEDEDPVRRLTCRILAGSGYECLEARGAEEALRLYDRHRDQVALLLSDVVMPGMSGQELAERIASLGSAPPVLFMSGYTDEAVLPREHPDGGTLLHKPFTAEALLRTVREAIEGDAR